MMSVKRLAVLASVLAAAAGAVVIAVGESTQARARGQVAMAPNEEIERLREEIARLQGSLALLAQTSVSGRQDNPAAAPGEGAPANTEPVGPTPNAAAVLSETEAREALARRFEEQPRHDVWGAQASSQARERLAAVMPSGSELRAIECRTSMCRIESAHADDEAFHAYVQAAFLSPETEIWNAGFTVRMEPDADGTLNGVAYLAREGEALPSLEELARAQ